MGAPQPGAVAQAHTRQHLHAWTSSAHEGAGRQMRVTSFVRLSHLPFSVSSRLRRCSVAATEHYAGPLGSCTLVHRRRLHGRAPCVPAIIFRWSLSCALHDSCRSQLVEAVFPDNAKLKNYDAIGATYVGVEWADAVGNLSSSGLCRMRRSQISRDQLCVDF